MDDALAKYFNRGDLTRKAVKDFRVVQGTAKDSGNVYYCVEIEFVNGFSKRMFLQNAEKFALSNAFEMVETTQQVESAF